METQTKTEQTKQERCKYCGRTKEYHTKNKYFHIYKKKEVLKE